MKIVITGASGFIGVPLAKAFLAKGADLLLVGRDPELLRSLFPGVECCNYAELPTRGRGYEALLHLAVLNNNSAATLDTYMQANVSLGASVLESSANAGIARMVNVSTIQALDPRNTSPYAVSKRIAAAQLQSASGIALRTLYFPAVIGERLAGRLAMVEHLPRAVRGHLLTLISALAPTVTIDSVIEACWNALVAAETPSEAIITSNQSRNIAFSVIKRALDIAGALVILIPFCWLLTLLWIAVRVQSPGPGIFAQQRVGRNGKVFTCYKFRTMSRDAPNVGTHEAPVTMVTPLGHFLRRTKLDELPQAVNILLNQMTLVGPRPCLPSQAEVIKQRNEQGVTDILPGITGLAQINQIDMSQPELLAQWDQRYLKLRSIKLDIGILLATAFGRGRGDAMVAQDQPRSP